MTDQGYKPMLLSGCPQMTEHVICSIGGIGAQPSLNRLGISYTILVQIMNHQVDPS